MNVRSYDINDHAFDIIEIIWWNYKMEDEINNVNLFYDINEKV